MAYLCTILIVASGYALGYALTSFVERKWKEGALAGLVSMVLFLVLSLIS